MVKPILNTSSTGYIMLKYDFPYNWHFISPDLPRGDLFRGFFRYYSEEFRFEEDVVSVRLGAVRAATAAEFHPKLFRSVHIKKGRGRTWNTVSKV